MFQWLAELNLTGVIILSVAISLALSFLTFKIRDWRLGKKVLTTQIYSLEENFSYAFAYRHSFLNGKHMELTVPEGDEKTYLVKETVYYNYKKDVSISVFQNGITVHTIDLRNIIYEQKLNIEEVE